VLVCGAGGACAYSTEVRGVDLAGARTGFCVTRCVDTAFICVSVCVSRCADKFVLWGKVCVLDPCKCVAIARCDYSKR
jgi:hypothetical protein